MPRRKPDNTHDDGKDGSTPSRPFPPEAYAYDSDVTDEVVRRVREKAEKILSQDEWEVIDGDKR